MRLNYSSFLFWLHFIRTKRKRNLVEYIQSVSSSSNDGLHVKARYPALIVQIIAGVYKNAIGLGGQCAKYLSNALLP